MKPSILAEKSPSNSMAPCRVAEGLTGPDGKPRMKPCRSISWNPHVEIWCQTSRSVSWHTHIEVFTIPARERQHDGYQASAERLPGQ
jgi:hypothetical protein